MRDFYNIPMKNRKKYEPPWNALFDKATSTIKHRSLSLQNAIPSSANEFLITSSSAKFATTVVCTCFVRRWKDTNSDCLPQGYWLGLGWNLIDRVRLSDLPRGESSNIIIIIFFITRSIISHLLLLCTLPRRNRPFLLVFLLQIKLLDTTMKKKLAADQIAREHNF